jgi:hypothetical protein
MYVWKVELEERWDYEDDFGDGNGETGIYAVVAESSEQALEKAMSAAKEKSFTDENDETVHHVVEARLVFVQRGVKLNA